MYCAPSALRLWSKYTNSRYTRIVALCRGVSTPHQEEFFLRLDGLCLLRSFLYGFILELGIGEFFLSSGF